MFFVLASGPRLARVLVTSLLLLLPLLTRADLPSQLAALKAGHPIAGHKIDAPLLLGKLYAGSGGAGLWQPAALASLSRAVEGIAGDGLNPEDYFASTLARGDLDPAARDVLASESLIRLAYSLRFGKINPRLFDPNWNYSRRLDDTEPVQWLRAAIARGDIDAALDELRPTGAYYKGLRAALAQYRAYAADGGWSALPTGEALKPGMDDPRVPALRKRLRAEGVDAPTDGGAHYDDATVAAVKTFQQRHGLHADGVVGAGTLAQLNVPVGARINTLRLNLERVRWVFHDLGPQFVVVNIAGFQAAYLDHGKRRWTGRVIVGKPFRQTPLFRAEISYLEFNPTWTVPPTILRQDLLPKIRADRGTLKQKNLEVLDSQGKLVDPSNVDWQRFHYTLRQKAGPDNALGRVKFMFPNPHSVYLHDTPSRELFAQSERAFSSGCIRIERPLELAEALLNDPLKWNRQAIDAAVASERTQRVNLPRKVPVMLMYLTAFPDPQGQIQFRRDLYARDAERLQALDGPFTISAPDDFKAR